jgi:L-malate glycosyltransferase
MPSLKIKTVLIIEEQMKQYRVPFYEKLYLALRQQGWILRVAYSDPQPSELPKRDNEELPAKYGFKVKAYRPFGKKALFQPLLTQAMKADLVISDEGNRYILSHVLLPLAWLRAKQVGLWGFAENRQSDRSELSEWYKQRTARWASWWFAYTRQVAQYLTDYGVSRDRITVVNNSVDVRAFRNRVANIDGSQSKAFRQQLGIGLNAPVGIYCGVLDRVKALPFLLAVGARIREQVTDFNLIIAGGGPAFDDLRRTSVQQTWIHILGPKFGEEKAQIFRLAEVSMIPGRVGLGILDSFAAGLPLLTTRLPIHTPEIEYLECGVNGLITDHDVAAFAATTVDLLLDKRRLAELRQGALSSSEKYSIEAMVQNYTEGIMQWSSSRSPLPQKAKATHHVWPDNRCERP